MRLGIVVDLNRDAQPGIRGALAVFGMRSRQGAGTHIIVYLRGIRSLSGYRIGN